MQLLKILLTGPDHIEFARTRLESRWLMHPVVKRLVQGFVRSKNKDELSAAAFLAEFDGDAAAQALLSELLAQVHAVPEPQKQLLDVLTRLRNEFINAELLTLTRRLSHPEASETERVELLHRQKELRALKQSPLAERAPGARADS
jgi:hypothetical protein